MNEPERKLKLHITQSVIAVFTLMAIIGTIFCSSVFAESSTDEQTIEAEQEMSETKAGVMKYALIAAAVAFGLGAIGAGIWFGVNLQHLFVAHRRPARTPFKPVRSQTRTTRPVFLQTMPEW